MTRYRERPLTSAALLPPPAPLPSLRDALARRAAVFGPAVVVTATTAPCGFWRTLGNVARDVVTALDPRALA